MILLDVNVLVAGFRADAQRHVGVARWLADSLTSGAALGVPDLVATGFLRVVTNHRVFVQPSNPEVAVRFLDALLAQPAAAIVTASSRHWPLLRGLVLDLNLRANDLPDAHLAALALDHGGLLATPDRGFARFRGLRLVEPVLEDSPPG